MPVFYVKQSSTNAYQFPGEFVYDLDGDPLVFKSILDKMPEGSALSSQGQFSWSPSRSQFIAMRKEPMVVEFIVQDQPEKSETIGKLKIAPTQQDLPPEILLVPGVPADSTFTIKEDETLNLKIYVSDPNGDDDVSHVALESNDKRVLAIGHVTMFVRRGDRRSKYKQRRHNESGKPNLVEPLHRWCVRCSGGETCVRESGSYLTHRDRRLRCPCNRPARNVCPDAARSALLRA